MDNYCHNNFRTTVVFNDWTRVTPYAQAGRAQVTVTLYLKNTPQTFTDIGFTGTPEDLERLFSLALEGVKQAQADLAAAEAEEDAA